MQKISTKTLVIIAVAILVLVNAGLLIWYLIKTQGDSQTAEPQAEIVIEDAGNGSATLYIDLSAPSTIVGAELYFQIDGSLDVTDIVCKAGFDCFEPTTEDSVLTVVALRPPSADYGALSGRVSVATLTYDTSTSGTLTINASGVTPSVVSSIDTTDNLISIDVQEYNVGGN
jgi:hypothetical protein